jgi:hypothetical protein
MASPKRVAYQPLMAWRSAGRPVAAVYWLRPSRMARSAAACTKGGAVKSGSPMLSVIIGRSPSRAPAAMSAAALASSIT